MRAWGILAVLVACADPVQAQSDRPAGVAAEAADVARGWALLTRGNAAEANNLAADLISKYPRSAAALVLAVEAANARSGAAAALDVYERWLGSRTVEDVYALRRIAHGALREIAQRDPERGRRLEAIEALVADGDTELAAVLRSSPDADEMPEVARAAIGDEQATATLLAQLDQPGPARRAAIVGLTKSRSARAVPRLVDLLRDPDPIVRSAAAEALGTLRAPRAVGPLKSLLNDPVFSVHFAAATALLALDDPSGLAWLRQLLTSDQPGIRVAAARATSKDADAGWLSVVRALTKDSDPEVRRQAAELIAPHDPELAKSTIEPLLNDPNPAERQAAADTYVQSITSDPAVLRRYLRSSDTGTRVRAAARLLEITR